MSDILRKLGVDNAEDLFKKFIEMDPKECKAMILGMFFGIGIYELFLDKEVEEINATSIKSWDNIKICFDQFHEARDLLLDLEDIIDKKGKVTVYDLYDAADLPTEPQMKGYGWKDLKSAKVDNECRLIMPPAIAL